MRESNKFYPTVNTEARDERNSIPKTVPVPEDEPLRIEVGSWIFDLLNAVISGIEEALADDGKISWSEAFSIAMELLFIVGQLLRGKK